MGKKLYAIKDIPMVGIVVTISPSFSLYNIVVFPAASSPTKKQKRKIQTNIQNDKEKTPFFAKKLWKIIILYNN